MERTIYNRQFGILAFICALTFKVSRLIPIMAEKVGSSGGPVIAAYLVLEGIGYACVYRVIRMGGIDEIAKRQNKVVNGIVLLLLSVFFVAKLSLMYSGTALFVSDSLFDGVPIMVVVLVLALPCVYMCVKGIRATARTAEIIVPFVLVVLALDFLFIKTNLDFKRNLPFFDKPMTEILSGANNFYFWFGDFLPFLFVKVKNNARNTASLLVAFAFTIITFSYILIYAIYGDMALMVEYPLVKFATFNQFSDVIGRLDWLGIIAWLCMAIVYLGVFMWGASEAVRRLTGSKILGYILGAGVPIGVCLFMNNISALIDIILGDVKYFALFMAFVMPLIILLLALSPSSKGEENEAVQE